MVGESQNQEGLDRYQQRAYARDLDRYLGEIKESIPRDESGRLHVLSVGCGPTGGFESLAFTRFFQDSDYLGIDDNQESLDSARSFQAIAANLTPPPNTRFSFEDARNVSGSEEGRYGLVIVGNPRFIGSAIPEWDSIMASTVKKMAPGGLIIVPTVDSRLEVIRSLEELKVQVIKDEGTPFDSPLTYRSSGDLILGRKI